MGERARLTLFTGKPWTTMNAFDDEAMQYAMDEHIGFYHQMALDPTLRDRFLGTAWSMSLSMPDEYPRFFAYYMAIQKLES